MHMPFAFQSITYTIISDQASFMIGPSDIRHINIAHAAKCSSWLACII